VVGLQPVTSGQPPDEAAARGELPTFKGYPHRITTQNRLYSLVFVYFSIPKSIKVKKPEEYSPGTLTDEYIGVTDKLKKIIPTVYFPISFLFTHRTELGFEIFCHHRQLQPALPLLTAVRLMPRVDEPPACLDSMLLPIAASAPGRPHCAGQPPSMPARAPEPAHRHRRRPPASGLCPDPVATGYP
jgi:hypothetical protein